MTSNKDAVAASTLPSPALEQQEAASPRPLQPDAEEPLVKKRRTKNFQLREDLAKSRGSAWNGYMARTKTMYRRRSSSTTTYWNSKHKFKKYPVPEDFKYATMAYWCTHGCIQPSRGNGVRTHLHNRYTGCSARITADVVFEVVEGEPNRVRWLVRVRNQISQHNHRISDEIYSCYTNNSSVPDELLLGPEGEQKQEQGDDADRVAEEATQAHAVPIASLAVDQATAATSEALGKSNAIASITGLPPGAAYYLTPRVEQTTAETSRAVPTPVMTDNRSGDEATTTPGDREMPEKSGQVLGNQRGPSEAV
ncbi:Pre-mRNA-splicing factor cwc2 [Phytophthora nicotianae]|uniref:Pre-mRNA-splicing factor cwc2 n=1 Tax=Phytophthora nicotianae TaxID=4792 RepID=A0A0W8DBR5_PHYNI|nr:Pre-mRNA-splicing factor cwc2 [Phytophthora nicotianae]